MADVQWIRLYTSFFQNRKIAILRSVEGGNDIVLFYLFLLTAAGRCNQGGELFFSENRRYNTFILAKEFGCTEQFVEKAINYLVAEDMIERSEDSFRVLDWEKHQNEDGLEKIRESNRKSAQRYREKKKLEEAHRQNDVILRQNTEEIREEEKREDKIRIENTGCSVPQLSAAPLLELPLNDNSFYPVYQKDVDEWKEVYRNVDVLQELKEMKVWCDANPAKCKTKKGIRVFIVNWLAKEQDKGGKTAPAQKQRPAFVPTEF